MQQNLFNNNFQDEIDFSEVEKESAALLQQNTLWEVNDHYSENPVNRFMTVGSPLTEMIYECGNGILEGIAVPPGLLLFLEQKFLPHLNMRQSQYAPLRDVAMFVFRYIDWQEPYFFLEGMPVSLTDDTHNNTYKIKSTGSILDPQDIEKFEVQRGWNFPQYTNVHKILTDPRIQAVARGEFVPHKSGDRGVNMQDVLQMISHEIFSNWNVFTGIVDEWIEMYYDDLRYDLKKISNEEELAELETAAYIDADFWYAVTLGIMTWLRSPNGLKFLIYAHPIYDALLDWNYDTNSPVIRPNTGGVAIVNSWTIYTMKDLEILTGVPPGTCCVSNQTLHCTKLVNAKAILSNCRCGSRRNIFSDSYYSDHQHTSGACREWERENPPQMVFVSYAAIDNILSNRDSKTKCQRFTCSNTKCLYHAGHYYRVKALNEQRVKRLTKQ